MKAKVLIIMGLTVFLAVSPVYAKKKDKGGKRLPPGLAKKAESDKPLPPGWQKKIAPGAVLEKEVFEHGKVLVPVDPLGIVTIKIDDKILRVHQKSMEILKILSE